jgi:hypothetical protein
MFQKNKGPAPWSGGRAGGNVQAAGLNNLRNIRSANETQALPPGLDPAECPITAECVFGLEPIGQAAA